MKKITLQLKERSYQILIDSNCLSQLGLEVSRLSIGRDAIVITNPLIRRLYGRVVAQSLKKHGCSVSFIEVPDSEKSKSQKVAFDVMDQIARLDIKKEIFIVALGGGVVGDLAGFVAAIYKRGIPYVQVPTTFLAQVDSAIGGKVAIDIAAGKNLVGAFYQPRMVFSDVSLLRTLTVRQLRNGLAEAVKYGMIKDDNLFRLIKKQIHPLLSADMNSLLAVIVRCSQIKTEIVSQDEKEKKSLRTILNFGHTVGHAIEAAGCYRGYQHGEAVSLGMRVAGLIAVNKGMFCPEGLKDLEGLLDQIGLPHKIKNLKMTAIIHFLQRDKKNIFKKNRFVLPVNIGKVQIAEGISSASIRQAISQYF